MELERFAKAMWMGLESGALPVTKLCFDNHRPRVCKNESTVVPVIKAGTRSYILPCRPFLKEDESWSAVHFS